MPFPCFTHETSLDNTLKAQISNPVAKIIHGKYQQLSFSIDQKMIAARYFLACLQAYDFNKLNEMLSSSDPTRLIPLNIAYTNPDIYLDVTLHVQAKPAYQFLLNLLVDGVFANLVGMTDILGKVIAEIYGFNNMQDAKSLHKVRDYMTRNYSSSAVSTYLQNNYPNTGTNQFHWLHTLKKIRNEVEHQDICEIGKIRAEYQSLGGYGSTSQVTIYLNNRFFQSTTPDNERNVLNFANSSMNSMSTFVNDIYDLLTQEIAAKGGVPI